MVRCAAASKRDEEMEGIVADVTSGPTGSGPSGSGSSAAAASTTPKLFVRQSWGLVRNVSVTNALFFNVAAFVGVGLTLYPIFYSLADVPVCVGLVESHTLADPARGVRGRAICAARRTCAAGSRPASSRVHDPCAAA